MCTHRRKCNGCKGFGLGFVWVGFWVCVGIWVLRELHAIFSSVALYCWEKLVKHMENYVGYRDVIVPKAVDIAKQVGLKAGNNLPQHHSFFGGCRRLLKALNLAVYLLHLQFRSKVSPPCLLLHDFHTGIIAGPSGKVG